MFFVLYFWPLNLNEKLILIWITTLTVLTFLVLTSHFTDAFPTYLTLTDGTVFVISKQDKAYVNWPAVSLIRLLDGRSGLRFFIPTANQTCDECFAHRHPASSPQFTHSST